MKRTLLDLTQSILSSLNSDEVNSISDSTESLQVADIIKTTYLNMQARIQPSGHNQLIQLNPSLDGTSPVLMYVPEGISKIIWLKYFNSNILATPSGTTVHGTNVNITPSSGWTTTSTTSNTIAVGSHTFTVASSTLPAFINQIVTVVSGVNSMTGTVLSYAGTTLVINATSIVGSGTFTTWTIAASGVTSTPLGYQYVTILPTAQFIDMVNSFNTGNNNVRTFTLSDNNNNFPGNYVFNYKNDKQPQFCTILSNYYVIFDGYDQTQDTTLQASKTMVEGQVMPVWKNEDSFIPNLDASSFPLLLNEAKSLAFFELKQMTHPKAEQEAKRGWSYVQRDKSVINRPTYFDALPNFGKSRGIYQGVGNWSVWRQR